MFELRILYINLIVIDLVNSVHTLGEQYGSTHVIYKPFSCSMT